MIKSIILIGAGKVATALGIALKQHGLEIRGVYNRSEIRGMNLAQRLDSEYFRDLSDLPEADLVIVSVSDHALPDLVKKIKIENGIIVHTSGTIGLDILDGCGGKSGVFYPPQTFTSAGPSDFSGIPFCIESEDETSGKDLEELALILGGKPVRMNSRQRLVLHLSAIISSNFTNYLYSAAQKILNAEEIKMEMLLPLINETASHASAEDIFALQTGPAVREDTSVIEKHLELLEKYPEIKEVYQLITKNIINFKKNNDKL